ncbi:sulfite exporter TauE/SafE family protein [Clostridiales bacterium COT073_COT-073]|nr:sulfite exporter TauE/SafE family protein [Clostridiales bacterium COT073_COT-073]
MEIIFFLVAFLASIIGAICGIGGGVIIKPTLDSFGMMSVATISFLSGCTVLAMSSYSVIKAKLAGDSQVDGKTGFPLAIGAVLGGIAGKELFDIVANLTSNREKVGMVQAICLLLITLGTLIYTIRKDKIKTRQIKNPLVSGLIGFCLGMISAFLGIGGGPMNLVVLFYFFSMQTKMAAANSLYIIFFSQLASLIGVIVTGKVPAFSSWILAITVIGGISGSIAGRAINKKIDNKVVDKLFIGLMIILLVINAYNIWRFA